MIIKKPDWVSHSQYPIFSVDIHPDGTRFATGGGDNKIKIWNLKALQVDDAEVSNHVTLLASLEEGSPVNCVRFSPNGKLLATGADDRTVLLWELREGNATKSFGSDEVNTENWCRVAALTGHSSDVVDLSWSPDSSKIVSCSLAKEVFVWDIHKRVRIASLTGHNGFVKGVAWDPLGKFIGSQSDDKTVIIWRVSDWMMETKISEPFKHSAGSAFYRRLSWSPDGSFLTTTHGSNGPSHVAPILDRTNWTVSCDFVGHKKPVICSKFNPSLYTVGKTSGQTKTFAYCAIGSQDCGITLWSTLSQRPKVICKQVFNQSVLDIAWAATGDQLLCCSTDGTIVYFRFEENELGTPLSPEEQKEKLREVYGDSIYQPSTESILAETPDQLQLEKETKVAPIESVPTPPSVTKLQKLPADSLDSTHPEPTFSSLPSGTMSHVQQKEIILQNGRRRITPQFLGQTSPSRAVTPLQSSATAVSTTTSITSDQPKLAMPIVSTSLPSSEKSSPEPEVRQPKRRRLKKHADGPNSKSVDKAESEYEKSKTKEKERDKGKEKAKEKEESKHKKPGGHPPSASSVTRRISGGGSRQSLPGVKAKGSGVSKSPHLPLPDRAKLKKLQRQLNGADLPLSCTDEPLFLEVSNFTGSTGECSAAISCRKGEKLMWEDTLRAFVTAIAGNSFLCAVGCEDGSLFIYTPAGRRMLPCIYLGSGLVYLEANADRHLVAVCGDCSIHLWDILRMESIMHGSVASLIEGNQNDIERVRVQATGQCVVTLKNMHSFTWSKGLGVWLRVGDFAFPRSSFATRLPSAERGEMPLASLQNVKHQEGNENEASSLLHLTGLQQNMETVAHLENQMAAALALESAVEYRYWLHTYTRYLATEAALTKLEELASALLGPPNRSSFSAELDAVWAPRVLGMSKRELLEEILPIMSSNRACQRLVAQFREYLNEVHAKETVTTNGTDDTEMHGD